MKAIRNLLIILLFPLMVNAQALNEFQWKNRVLLLFTPSPQATLFQRQVALLDAVEEGMVDRRLATIFVEKSGDFENTSLFVRRSQAEWYYDHFNVEPHQFALVLVGLDGNTKIRYVNQVIEPQTIFEVIDGMPMRQNELRLRRRNSEGSNNQVRKY